MRRALGIGLEPRGSGAQFNALTFLLHCVLFPGALLNIFEAHTNAHTSLWPPSTWSGSKSNTMYELFAFLEVCLLRLEVSPRLLC